MPDMNKSQQQIEMINNPLSEGISHISSQIKGLNFSSINAIPSFITLLPLCIAVLLMVILWPIGLFVPVEDLIRKIITETINKMEGKTIVQQTPYVISIGLYFLVWLPFAIVCAPFFIIGMLGEIFKHNKRCPDCRSVRLKNVDIKPSLLSPKTYQPEKSDYSIYVCQDCGKIHNKANLNM